MNLFIAFHSELNISASKQLMPVSDDWPKLVGSDPRSAMMMGRCEFATSIESDQAVAASSQQEIELTWIAGAIEAFSCLVEVVLPTVLYLGPHLLVAAEERPWFVLDQVPEINQWTADVAAPNPLHINVGNQKLLQDGPAADERLIVGGDLPRKVPQDLRGLPALAVTPLDENPISLGRRL